MTDHFLWVSVSFVLTKTTGKCLPLSSVRAHETE